MKNQCIYNFSHQLRILILGVLGFLKLSSLWAQEDQTEVLKMADPSIFYHEGRYYLYGTGRADEGFQVYTSKDAKHWSGPAGKLEEGFCLHEKDVFGDRGFWAPQVFGENGKFYMAYTANEHIALAESDSPLGPFRQTVKQAIEGGGKMIDPFFYRDQNGKAYLYFVKVADGGNRIYVAEMKEDLSGIKTESSQLCIEASEAWENAEQANWTVTEGPSVLFHQGYYYLIYSANDFRSKHYAVGVAVSEHPLGPWEKMDGQPALSQELLGVPGTGHGDFFSVKDDLYYVFHTHQSGERVGPRKTALIKVQFNDSAAGLATLDFLPKSWKYLFGEDMPE
ncbi:glycoside hydrolase family 43 protein [Echinicola marina]|uniref:glycoside hydrolase family 43 protein n=1 Tax=Echinicola marina TaxID=2859768 RepID=UPI001CF6C1ED|nr:glycoside hydrolase family 43 protein [Echinicola marina]UCS94023.1 glycoside hydrolase family 43 protein [Echinicola marina]